jgi:hypothetical protein
MGLSQEQITELEKMKKLERTYDGILKTSRNADQVQRSQIELKKIKDRISEIDPNGIYIEGQDNQNSKPVVSADPFEGYAMLSRFPLQRASTHSNDADINMMFSIINAWETVFMTALFDKHVKLDYSLNNERDTHYALLSNVKRYLKTLCETVEDYQSAIREDAKLQLVEMKRRYARQFLNEGAAYLRKIKTFWENIDIDVKSHGSMCTNREDRIVYDTRFEVESFLKGETVETVIHKASMFLGEAVKVLRLPELPGKK